MLLGKDYIDELNRLGQSGEPFLFIIDFEEQFPMVFRMGEIPEGIRFSMPANQVKGPRIINSAGVNLYVHPVPFAAYLPAFNLVMDHLQKGNSYLVNLTFPTPVNTGLSLEEIFEVSEAPYKLLVKGRFVVFSPEPFIRIKNGSISSYPMKGTIDASLPDAATRVLNDPKEAAEHHTIVDLIRNDISRVAFHVEVKRFRYIEKIHTLDRVILQVSSEICGILPDDYTNEIGTILDSLLPAGSISGAPKKRTLEIIREAEPEARGYYTGIFGTFDGRNLDSAVMIRFIENSESGLRYRSGGGITHLSNARAEYQEMIDKVYLPKKSDL